jgi:hypothetical protein
MSRMKKLTSATIAATCAATIALMPATTASATSHDCRILGPDYVGEVVDCVIYIYERAIG